jgi:hypothetical protein
MIDIHWSQLSVGRGMTTFVEDNWGWGASSERSRRCFCAADMRGVMWDLASWTTRLRAIDRSPAIVDV